MNFRRRALRPQQFVWIAVCSSEYWTVTVVRVLCDGFGHAVVDILFPSTVSSFQVLDFSVGLD